MVYGVTSNGGGISSTQTDAIGLSETPGGVNPVSVNHLDLVPMAVYSELEKGGEETRSPVNCFEFKNGASSKKEEAGSLLDRRPSQGGKTSVRKTVEGIAILEEGSRKD